MFFKTNEIFEMASLEQVITTKSCPTHVSSRKNNYKITGKVPEILLFYVQKTSFPLNHILLPLVEDYDM